MTTTFGSAPPSVDAIGFYAESELDPIIPVSRVTRWRMVRAKEFPSPVQLSPGRVGYLKSEVHAWIRGRMEAAGKVSAAPEAARSTSATAGQAT